MITYFEKSRFFLALLISASLLIVSCGEDEEDTPDVVVEEPFADFTITVDEENTLMVSFANNSIDGDNYAWDFGDNIGTSTDENTVYTYTSSGTFTVSLTVTNEAGSDEATKDVTVSGFGDNLLVNGDMSDETGWTSNPLWTAEDNATNHRFENGTFIFQSAANPEGGFYEYSNHVLFQEVQLTAGSTYQFSADVSSTSGTVATWFEVYLVKEAPVDESNIGGDFAQLAIKSYGDGENCTSSAFSGDILEIAGVCSAANDFSKLIDANGQFTVTSDDLSATGSLFLVMKVGSGWPPENEAAGFGDGIVLDNVVIKEAL